MKQATAAQAKTYTQITNAIGKMTVEMKEHLKAGNLKEAHRVNKLLSRSKELLQGLQKEILEGEAATITAKDE